MLRRTSITIGLLLIISGTLLGQFNNVNITIDYNLLKESDRQKLSFLDQEIERFYTHGAWDENWSDLNIPLSIQMVFEGVSEKGSIKSYTAQLMITGGMDTRFFDKSVQFYYNSGTPLFYDPVVFEPLPFLLKYYGLLIMGTEVDTYEPLGGTNFIEKSRNIANMGASSDYPRGWGDRIKDLDQLVSNYGLRKARFSFYYGSELFRDGEIEEAVNEFEFMIAGLQESTMKDPRDPHTLYFLKAHNKDITGFFTTLNRKKWLSQLIDMDPDNEDSYGSALESLK